NIALTSGPTINAWGNNDSGRLGNGTNTDQHAPVQYEIRDGPKIVDVFYTCMAAAGNSHTVWNNNGEGPSDESLFFNAPCVGILRNQP
ncbi:MAG: RCC1 domain-containing protein, partial [Desulfobacterales bacterium]